MFLTVKQIAEKYNLTEKYVRKYSHLLGGIQPGGKHSKILFLEGRIEDALLQQTKESMGRESQAKRDENDVQDIPNQEECSSLGNRRKKKSTENEDRHGLRSITVVE